MANESGKRRRKRDGIREGGTEEERRGKLYGAGGGTVEQGFEKIIKEVASSSVNPHTHSIQKTKTNSAKDTRDCKCFGILNA